MPGVKTGADRQIGDTEISFLAQLGQPPAE
jgi:hypothetical protein